MNPPVFKVASVGEPDVSLAEAELVQLLRGRISGRALPVPSGTPLRARRTCVYRFFNASGELLYIGVAANLASRTSAHRSASRWFHEVATVTEQWFDSRDQALTAEAKAIKGESPRYNVTSKPKSGAASR